jgi:serine/threonine-protein kinase
VHRDVKPGNVLITPTGTVKVTDFGIARAGTSENLTQTGSVMGTATYFSPEQAQGLAVDGRSDVYSLGVVLYEMVTGLAPFSGEAPLAVALKHVREEPIPPSARNQAVPPAFEQIVLAAMAKDADQRYQSADELRADLLRFRRGRPLASTPVTAMIATTPPQPTGAAVAAADATQAAPRVAPVAAATRPRPPGRSRAARLFTTAVVLLLLVLVVGGILLLATVNGKNSGTLEVPDVTKVSQTQARQTLTDDGFAVKVTLVTNATKPVNQVISQDPNGGTRAKKGSTVTLTVSKGSGEIKVPDLSGRTVPDATNVLKSDGLKVGSVSQEASDSVPVNTIIRTDPASGTSVGRGFAVKLVVSSGPQPVPVPNVLNEPVNTAFSQLQHAGFIVFQTQAASDTVPSGSVISTNPAPNTPAPKGSRVTVVVSTGAQMVTVDDVTGQSEGAAKSDLENQGFVVVIVHTPSTPANVGKVISQDPQGGTQQKKGTTIVLTVGESTTTTSGGTTTTT